MVLPIVVKPASPGSSATLVAEATFGLCKDVCVPVSAHLEVPLGTGHDARSDERLGDRGGAGEGSGAGRGRAIRCR